MTSAYLQQWIQHPEMLNKDTLYELRTLLVRYPYFSRFGCCTLRISICCMMSHSEQNCVRLFCMWQTDVYCFI